MKDKKTLEIMGDRIRQCRQEKGLTIEGLASKMGIGANALGEWERGKRSMKDPKTIMWLAEYFNVSSAYLLGTKEERGSFQEETHDGKKEKAPGAEKENYWESISEAYNSLKADSRLIVENMIRKLVIADRVDS